MAEIIIIGYSGHAYVVCDTFATMGYTVTAYCEPTEKKKNPYKLSYLGDEKNTLVLKKIKKRAIFIAIGDNLLRRNIMTSIESQCQIINSIHETSILSNIIHLGKGILIGPSVVINSEATIGDGVICNTGSIIEHECKIDKFVHIAPGAIICGNVEIGENTLIGAGAIIKPNIKIGKNVTIGMGAVIVKNVSDNSKIVGNPQRIL